jgi:hypothetical protein
MPNIEKAERREKKQHKARYGMRVSGRSTKSVLLQTIEKKTKELIRGKH